MHELPQVREGVKPLAKAEIVSAPAKSISSDSSLMAPPSDKGTVSPSGVFNTVVPDFVSPDYKGAAVDSSALVQKAEGLIVSDGPDKAQIGLVTIDRKSREISFPAHLNMQAGLLEYAVVNVKGKAHESLLTSEASPLHVHLAALLLDIARPDGGGEFTKLAIEVEWQANGPVRRVPLESLIARAKGVPLDPMAARSAGTGDNVPKEEPGDELEAGPWIYCGSTIRQGALMAAAEGSMISLLNDPAALIYNPRPGNTNDRLHVPGRNLPPAANFPVVIHLRPFSEK